MSTKDSYASIASNNVANSPSMTENSVSTPTFGASSIPNPLESTPTPANITGTSSPANANGTASSAATGADPNVNDSSYLLSPSVLSTHNNHGSRNLLAGGSGVGAASEVNNLSGVLMGLSLDPNTTATQDSNNDHNANGTKSIFSSHFYNGDNSSPVVVPSTPPPQNQSQIQNGSQKNIDQTANNTQQQQQDQKFTSVFSSTQPGTPNWASSKNDPQKSQQQQGSQSNTTSGSFLPDITMATTPQQSNAQQFLPMGSQNFISLTPNPFNSQMGNNQSTPFSSKIEVPSTAPPVPVGRSSSLGIVGGGSTMRPFVLPESVQVQQQNGGANSNSDSVISC
ncbi:unnamed protein product [[Candida] boidinii]|nr:unnamed protein product [[Candida] boidinii]